MASKAMMKILAAILLGYEVRCWVDIFGSSDMLKLGLGLDLGFENHGSRRLLNRERVFHESVPSMAKYELQVVHSPR